MEPDAAFPYLGCTVASNNSDWEDLYQNLLKSQRWWGMVEKVLKRMGATVQTRVMLYKEVVHTVLIYGSKIWVMMGAMLKVLEGFHHGVARWIAGNTACRTVDGEWEWPTVA